MRISNVRYPDVRRTEGNLNLLLVLAAAAMAAGVLWLATPEPACARGACEGRVCLNAANCAPCNTCMKTGIGLGTCVHLETR